MSKKRAQITLYLTLGTVMLLSIGLLFYIGSSKGKTIEPVSREQVSLQTDALAVKLFVNNCVKQGVIAAIETNAPVQKNEKWYEAFIESEVLRCTDFSSFRKRGLEIENGDVKAKVTITENSVKADVNFPAKVKKENLDVSFSQFVYSWPTTNYFTMPLDFNGVTTAPLAVRSEGSTELIIPKGTKVACSEGIMPDRISLKIIPKTFNGEENEVSLNPVLSEFIVDGCRELSFEPAKEEGISVTGNAAASDELKCEGEGDIKRGCYSACPINWSWEPSKDNYCTERFSDVGAFKCCNSTPPISEGDIENPTIYIDVNEKLLPKDVPIENLAVARFNQCTGVWESLPSKVDTLRNVVSAEIKTLEFEDCSGFPLTGASITDITGKASPAESRKPETETSQKGDIFAVVINCQPGNEKNRQTVTAKWIYKEPCYTDDIDTDGDGAVDVSGTKPQNCMRWLLKKGDGKIVRSGVDYKEGYGDDPKPSDGPIYAPPEQLNKVKIWDALYGTTFNKKENGKEKCSVADWDEDDKNNNDWKDVGTYGVKGEPEVNIVSERCEKISVEKTRADGTKYAEEEWKPGHNPGVTCDVPVTPKNYGYEKIADAGGKAKLKLELRPDGASCATQTKSMEIELECDDECKASIEGAKNADFRIAKSPDDPRSTEDNTFRLALDNARDVIKEGENTVSIDVQNNFEPCSMAYGTITFMGTGLYKKCSEINEDYKNPLPRSCQCGNTNVLVTYKKGKYEELKEPDKENNQKLREIVEANQYCCPDGEVKNDPSECKIIEEPKAKEKSCTAQERISYLCWSGGKNEISYNDKYPDCSGTDSSGKLIGFSDPDDVPGLELAFFNGILKDLSPDEQKIIRETPLDKLPKESFGDYQRLDTYSPENIRICPTKEETSKAPEIKLPGEAEPVPVPPKPITPSVVKECKSEGGMKRECTTECTSGTIEYKEGNGYCAEKYPGGGTEPSLPFCCESKIQIPQCASLSVDRQVVNKGESVEITYSTENADKAFLGIGDTYIEMKIPSGSYPLDTKDMRPGKYAVKLVSQVTLNKDLSLKCNMDGKVIKNNEDAGVSCRTCEGDLDTGFEVQPPPSEIKAKCYTPEIPSKIAKGQGLLVKFKVEGAEKITMGVWTDEGYFKNLKPVIGESEVSSEEGEKGYKIDDVSKLELGKYWVNVKGIEKNGNCEEPAAFEIAETSGACDGHDIEGYTDTGKICPQPFNGGSYYCQASPGESVTFAHYCTKDERKDCSSKCVCRGNGKIECVESDMKPDLTPRAIDFKKPIQADSSVTFKADIFNDGIKDSGPFNIQWVLCRFNDVSKEYDNSCKTSDFRIESIPRKTIGKAEFTWRKAENGKYRLRLIANANKKVSEENENNNIKETFFTVGSIEEDKPGCGKAGDKCSHDSPIWDSRGTCCAYDDSDFRYPLRCSGRWGPFSGETKCYSGKLCPGYSRIDDGFRNPEKSCEIAGLKSGEKRCLRNDPTEKPIISSCCSYGFLYELRCPNGCDLTSGACFPYDDSKIISDTFLSIMKTDTKYVVSITIKNTGTKTWKENYYLGKTASDLKVYSDEEVPPGKEITFNFNFITPQTTGNFAYTAQMSDGSKSFGETFSKKITIRSQ